MMWADRIDWQIAVFGILVLCGSGFAQSGDPEERDPFRIAFNRTKVSFSGCVDDKKTADELATAILSARPDLKVVNSGMSFDSKVKMPSKRMFQALVTEVALSTHEGVVEVSDRKILVGGLTDSVVTSSVLKLRVRPILGERKYVEQLCEIPSEDLPELPVLLSNGESRQNFSFDLSLVESDKIAFEAPGILLHKIAGLIEDSDDLGMLITGQPTPPGAAESDPGESKDTNSAMTVARVEQNSSREPAGEEQEAGAMPGAVANPVPNSTVAAPVFFQPDNSYQEIGRVHFASNSFLLASGEQSKIKYLTELLKSPELAGVQVTVKALEYRSGSADFAEWLAGRRLREFKKLLQAEGVSIDGMRISPEPTGETTDRGAVVVLIPAVRVQPSTESTIVQPASSSGEE